MPDRWVRLSFAAYSVSSSGQVMNDETGRILKGRLNRYGYRRVGIRHSDGSHKDHYVHRLVCAAFHGPAPEGWEAHHINHRPGDDREDNLEWVTKSDNLSHRRFRNGSTGHHFTKLTEDQVVSLRNGDFDHLTNAELSEILGITPRSIRRIKSKERWKHVGTQ